MSRIGNKLITLPKGVEVSEKNGVVLVKGPKGQISKSLVPNVSIKVENGTVKVLREGNSKSARSFHGLMRALLANMIKGVSEGINKSLEMIGVGYKAEIKGKKLVLNLGFSHLIDYPFPEGISIAVKQNPKSTLITISGVDKEIVGQTAAKIRSFRPPDSYKGKGVRYAGETVRLKTGKQ